MIFIFCGSSRTIKFYTSAVFHKFSFMQICLYLQKYRFLTKRMEFSCSSLHRSEAENKIRAAHVPPQLTVHLQNWICGERTGAKNGEQGHEQMHCKICSGATADTDVPGGATIPDAIGRFYLYCDALCSIALIWSLEEMQVHPSTLRALVSLQENSHTKAGKALQCTSLGAHSNLFCNASATIRMKIQQRRALAEAAEI